MKVLKGCAWGIFVLAALTVILFVVVVVANLYTAGRSFEHYFATETAVARSGPIFSPPMAGTPVIPASSTAPDMVPTVNAGFDATAAALFAADDATVAARFAAFDRQVTAIVASRSATAAAVDAAFRRLFATVTPTP